jgi:chemotaxis protein MotA
MDISTLIGLILAVVAVIGSLILEGGDPLSLINVPAAVIVFGGTFGATLISFPLATVLRLPGLLGQSFQAYKGEPKALIELFVNLADQARREGLLSLESESEKIDDPFIKKGVMLVVDGIDPAVVREVLETDTHLVSQRHKSGYSMLEAMGGFAPTMGIIGTVLGLINVLSRLSNPEDLGHSIAGAFIATLYGIASANLAWLPIGVKLKGKSGREIEVRELVIEGILSVQAGDNPRIVRDKLESFLAPKLRGQESDSKKGAEGKEKE